MPNILCIDASTEACSVALIAQNETISRYQVAPRLHAKLLIPMVDEVLNEAGLTLQQLDAIACHVGPGAFTGIRIGVSVAQGLAFGANLATIAVSSLASMANQVIAETKAQTVLTAIDARMDEIYFGLYQSSKDGLATLAGVESVIAPADLSLHSRLTENKCNLQNLKLVGSGWMAYQDQLKTQLRDCDLDFEQGLVKDRFPNAHASLSLALEEYHLGQLLEPEALQPVYLRNNVAHKKVVKK
jgi:tRNA threonylcarbamoyladenosine biosynthesis protein TsaB